MINFFYQVSYHLMSRICQEVTNSLRRVKVSFNTSYYFFISQSFNKVLTALLCSSVIQQSINSTSYHFFVSQSFNEVSMAYHCIFIHSTSLKPRHSLTRNVAEALKDSSCKCETHILNLDLMYIHTLAL